MIITKDYIVPPEETEEEYEEYEEYENVILPETMWGEIYYIYCMVKRIITSPKDREFQKYLLKRQIRIYRRWRQVRKK